MNVVGSLLPAPRLQRLRSAVSGHHAIHACDDWQSLTRLCESAPVQTVVVDFVANGRASFDELRVLRGRFPRVAVVGYLTLPPARTRDVFDAGRFGLDGLLVTDDEDSPSRILEVLAQAGTRSVATLLAAALTGTSRLLRDALLLSVTRANSRLTPLVLARQLGVSRRGLAHQLSLEGFPAPQRLITWGRLIVAGQLLESKQTTADAVASALHFPSGSAFRNTCQRYLRATPSEVRRRGGAEYVARSLLRQMRQPARGRSSPLPHGRSRAPLVAV
ncbi:MAG TPA: AraC family transcriptional regulator [Gemmatimonadaceae bacterium]|nr:AraC family transcriptional regulator [Gemmatimonadaceae bacterium]